MQETLFQLVQAIFAFFGGGVAATAVVAFSANFFVKKEIEKQKAAFNKELETHKLSLKKQELIFNKELEAAEAAGDFMKLHRQIRPSLSSGDGMGRCFGGCGKQVRKN